MECRWDSRGKLEFGEERPGIEQHCHSEPARTLVWESPSNFGQSIVIQSVLLHRFPEFIHEKLYFCYEMTFVKW